MNKTVNRPTDGCYKNHKIGERLLTTFFDAWKLRFIIFLLTLSSATISIPLAYAQALAKGACENPQPRTDLRHCRFEKTVLQHVNLSGADLRGVSFYKSQLKGVNLTDARLDGAVFTGAALVDTQGVDPRVIKIWKKSFLVRQENKKSSVTLRLHAPVDIFQDNIAGLANFYMASAIKNTSHIIAMLDFPRYSDGPKSTIVSLFSENSLDVPHCYRQIELLTDSSRYYGAGWDSMDVKKREDNSYLLALKASGGDAGDTWTMVAFLAISSSCGVKIVSENYASLYYDVDGTCEGDYLDYRILNDRLVEIKKTTVNCKSDREVKEKISYKKVDLTSAMLNQDSHPIPLDKAITR